MRIVIYITALLITANCFGQAAAKEKELSNSDKFSLKTGILFQKNTSDVGKFKNVGIEVLEIINLMDKSKSKSIRLTKEAEDKYASESVAVIDNDEVDGLIKSFELIKSNTIATKPEIYTEVSYKTRSGYEAGAYYSEKDKAWQYYMKLDKYDRKSYEFFGPDELTRLLELLNTAKAKLA